METAFGVNLLAVSRESRNDEEHASYDTLGIRWGLLSVQPGLPHNNERPLLMLNQTPRASEL